MLKPSKASGFTLVELMIVIAILAILMTLAAPSFSVIIANSKIRANAQAIIDGLQLARAEAIRRNERVKFVLSSDTSWTVITNANTTIQTRSAGDGGGGILLSPTPSNSTMVTFNPLGRVVNNTDGSSTLTQVDIDVPTTVISATESHDLRIIISSGGLIRLCDPNIGSGDPRSCT